MPFQSPFSPTFRNRLRSPHRARGRRFTGQFTPQSIDFTAYYDANNGGSATQITDSSGNSVDPFAFAAAAAAPSFLGYTAGVGIARFPAIAGNHFTTPDAAAFDLTGDLELWAWVNPRTTSLSGDSTLIGKYGTTANQRSYHFYLKNGTAEPGLRISPAGTSSGNAQIEAAVVPTYGTGLWVGVKYTAATGAAVFYTLDAAATTTPTIAAATILASPAAVGATAPFSGSAALEIGAINNGAVQVLDGNLRRAIVRNAAGTTVADWRAVDSGQTGYTDSLGVPWTGNRATAGKKLATVGPSAGAESTVVFGTDDYGTVPVGAIPSMGASDAWSIVLVLRQWNTPTSFGRYLSTKTGSGTGKGISIRTNGTGRQIACHFGDGTNGVDSFGPAAAAAGVRQVVVVSCTGPSVTIYVNGQAGTPVDISSVGDRATGQMEIGRDSGAASNYQDFELLKVGTVPVALSAGTASALSTYYGGGL